MFSEIFLKLTKQLYPTGRAFKMPVGGIIEGVHRALAEGEARVQDDAKSLLYSILPDNPDFDAVDAALWETKLGIITNELTPLSDRKLALLRKMRAPGTVAARGHYLYIQNELHSAGFTNLFVYENRFVGGLGLETKTPSEFSLIDYPTADHQHADSVQHDDIEHGGVYANKVVNYIDQAMDDPFDLGDNYRSTFFICGDPAGSWADVIESRKDELRHLILKLKHDQMVGFLLINYI